MHVHVCRRRLCAGIALSAAAFMSTSASAGTPTPYVDVYFPASGQDLLGNPVAPGQVDAWGNVVAAEGGWVYTERSLDIWRYLNASITLPVPGYLQNDRLDLARIEPPTLYVSEAPFVQNSALNYTVGEGQGQADYVSSWGNPTVFVCPQRAIRTPSGDYADLSTATSITLEMNLGFAYNQSDFTDTGGQPVMVRWDGNGVFYFQTPSPGPAAVFGLAGALALRRRRR